MRTDRELFRHARRRSKFHSIDHEDRAHDRAEFRPGDRASKKPMIYRDIDNDWLKERRRGVQRDAEPPDVPPSSSSPSQGDA